MDGKDAFIKIININNQNGGINGLELTATGGAKIIEKDASTELKEIEARNAILKKQLEAAEMEDKLHQLALGKGLLILL